MSALHEKTLASLEEPHKSCHRLSLTLAKMEKMHTPSHTHFLKRDALYEEEKPYSLRYTPPDGFPRSNITLERHEIAVHDIRPVIHERTFKKDGCAVMNLDSQMKYEDWDDEIKIKGVYLAEVADSLCKALDACNVQIFEHTVRLSIVFRPTGPEKLKVRKRHDIFPISTGEPYKYNQPTSIAHVGKYYKK